MVGLLVALACVAACVAVGARPLAAQAPDSTLRPPIGDTTQLVVRRPTVVAYFVVPAGAVDTNPDFATMADDWSYSMAMFGDTLEAHGIGHALVVQPWLRVGSRGAAPVTLRLEPLSAGFVFVRPGAKPCVWRGGWGEPDSVMAAARRYFARPAHGGSRRGCSATTR